MRPTFYRTMMSLALLLSVPHVMAEDVTGTEPASDDLPYNFIVIRENIKDNTVKVLLMKVEMPADATEQLESETLVSQVAQHEADAKVVKLEPIPQLVMQEFFDADTKNNTIIPYNKDWRGGWNFFVNLGSAFGLFGRGNSGRYGYNNGYYPNYGFYRNDRMYRFNNYPNRYRYPNYHDSYYYYR